MVAGLPILIVVVVALVALVISYAILAVICWILSGCYQRIPQPHRQMEPGMVWLLLIPCFNVVWIFFVYLRLSNSFKSYFNSIGRTDVGDCGFNLGLAYCICAVLSAIPYLGACIGLAALVLLILYLVKVTDLKRQIPENPGLLAPPPPAILPG